MNNLEVDAVVIKSVRVEKETKEGEEAV